MNAARPITAAVPPRLPLVTLYLSERCNSRCVTCDYWRTGRDHLTLGALHTMLPGLALLGTRVALLSGGEPLLNPEWRAIALALRDRGIERWLLTSGLSLSKHAATVAELFDAVTVSLDGANPSTYRAIRGLDAFEVVCEGVRALAAAGLSPGLRVTVQRANYREMPALVRLARDLGAAYVSFLAVDVGNPHAFGRDRPLATGLALEREDLQELDSILAAMRSEFAAEFANGLIAESSSKLAQLRGYFAALLGDTAFPPARCNAPEFSAVIGVDGSVSPCFFIAGPRDARAGGDPSDALESAAMRSLRADIRAGRRTECERCVCSLWRDPSQWSSLSARRVAQERA
jgi:MoaA/NifB/PqqE/SkfB family radical SAM enzyme